MPILSFFYFDFHESVLLACIGFEDALPLQYVVVIKYVFLDTPSRLSLILVLLSDNAESRRVDLDHNLITLCFMTCNFSPCL